MTSFTFASSGTLGDAVLWGRNSAQVQAEFDAVVARLPERPDSIQCFAPAKHYFGHLFGTFARKVGIQACHLGVPPLPLYGLDGRVLIATIPSSWFWIERMLGRIEASAASVQFLHGGGPIPPAATEFIGRAKIQGLELFGSTETGAIGYRDLLQTQFTVFDDVILTRTPAGTQVEGPRVALTRNDQPTHGVVIIPDELAIAGRTFKFLGRSGCTINHNGHLFNLGRLEEQIRIATRAVAAIALATDDELGGESYVVGIKECSMQDSDVTDLLRAMRPKPTGWFRIVEGASEPSGKVSRSAALRHFHGNRSSITSI